MKVNNQRKYLEPFDVIKAIDDFRPHTVVTLDRTIDMGGQLFNCYTFADVNKPSNIFQDNEQLAPLFDELQRVYPKADVRAIKVVAQYAPELRTRLIAISCK